MSRRPYHGGTDSRPGECLQSQFPRIQDARGIESVLDSAGEVHSGPELLAHEVRELHPDPVDVFHGAAQRMGVADQRIERPRDGGFCRGTLTDDGLDDFHGDQLRLSPQPETDRMDVVMVKDRQRGSSECQDPRTREGDVNVVEDGLFQRDVGASHPRGDFVVHVEDVVAGLPVTPSLAVRQGPRMARFHAPAYDPPRGGHNLLCPGESQVERGRARLAAPGEGRGLERLLEIHDAGCQSVVIEPAECRESGREVLQAERMNLLRFRDWEDTKGGAGHDTERPFRTDEEALQIQARRGSGGGPGSDHAPIREDGFESQDLVSHRPAKITGVADAVRPDRSAYGGPGPGPGIVSQSEPSLPEPTVP